MRADEFEHYLEYLYENYKFFLFLLAKLILDNFDREYRNALKISLRLHESHGRRDSPNLHMTIL